jgi:RNA polymerase sigma-54 factor
MDAATILKCSEQEIEEAIHLIQSLEPAGIGARNLQECLLLQLERSEDNNKLASMILSDYFLLFAEKKWKTIAKELSIELKEIQEVFDYIQFLNPRPASDFYQEPAPYIVPDLNILREGEDLTVHFFDEAMPKIRFNEKYFRQLNGKDDEKVKRFLQEKQQDFHWITKSLDQRRDTLIKVALKIIEKQPDYFINGPTYLKPMTMKEISDEIGIHESTVSRAVREKYAQTPFGTVELRSFFSSTIKTTSSEDASAVQVKKEIADLIQKEKKTKPLSDQELVHLLEKNNGLIVSRRTIAKYRDQLGIPSSSKRKRFG